MPFAISLRGFVLELTVCLACAGRGERAMPLPHSSGYSQVNASAGRGSFHHLSRRAAAAGVMSVG